MLITLCLAVLGCELFTIIITQLLLLLLLLLVSVAVAETLTSVIGLFNFL